MNVKTKFNKIFGSKPNATQNRSHAANNPLANSTVLFHALSFLRKRKDITSARCVSKLWYQEGSKVKIIEGNIHTDESLYYQHFKERDPNKQKAMLEIMDTAGVPDFEDRYIADSDGFVLVYSILSQDSFNYLPKLYEKIKLIKGYTDKNKIRIPTILVGNKLDLEYKRVVTCEGRKLAEKMGGIPFMETSAKINTNVDIVFSTLVRIMPLQTFPTKYKIVVMGTAGVGRSTLTAQYISGQYVIFYDNTHEDAYKKEIAIDNLPTINSTAKNSNNASQKSWWKK